MKISTMKRLYNVAKDAKVGIEITCPSCGLKHTKTTYNKVFCSNAKSKVWRNCKDAFWNKVDPEKACRNTQYFRDVILREAVTDFDDDPSWDAHKDY